MRDRPARKGGLIQTRHGAGSSSTHAHLSSAARKPSSSGHHFNECSVGEVRRSGTVISLIRTLKDSGMPGSGIFSPDDRLVNLHDRPSSDLTRSRFPASAGRRSGNAHTSISPALTMNHCRPPPLAAECQMKVDSQIQGQRESCQCQVVRLQDVLVAHGVGQERLARTTKSIRRALPERVISDRRHSFGFA